MSVFDEAGRHDSFVNDYLVRNGYERIAQLMDKVETYPNNGSFEDPRELRRAPRVIGELITLLEQLRDTDGQVDRVVERADLIIRQLQRYIPRIGPAATSSNAATTATTDEATEESTTSGATRALSARLKQLRTALKTVKLDDRYLIAQSTLGVTEIDWQILMNNIPSIKREVVNLIKDNIEAAIDIANERAAEALERKTTTNKGASVKICVYYPNWTNSDDALLCIRVKDKRGGGGNKLATEVLVDGFPERTYSKKTMPGWAQ